MHQDGIYGDAMEPGGQRRVSFKGRQLSEHLQECILGEVLSLCRVVRHAQTNAIDPRLVRVKQLGKRFGVPFLARSAISGSVALRLVFRLFFMCPA